MKDEALAFTTFLPIQSVWYTYSESWSSKNTLFLSSIRQQLWAAAWAKRKWIFELWKQALIKAQLRLSHTFKYLSSETLTILPLPSTSMLRMQPSWPSNVLTLSKEERSHTLILQPSNCPRLEASALPPSNNASCLWQLRMPYRLPKTRCTCGCWPRMSHIFMAESSLPENSLNCPSCSRALMSEACACMDLYWNQCQQKSCPSMAPRKRLPLALMAAVMLFLGEMAVTACAAASRLIWSMLGMCTCRCLREPAMREAILCFCLMFMMNFSCSMSLGGQRCHSSTLLSSTAPTFYKQLMHVTSVCVRKPYSSASNSPIFAFISPSSSPALRRSFASDQRQAFGTLQSGSGSLRMNSLQYCLREVWMHAMACGEAVAQGKHRISLLFMMRKRQLGCSCLHCGQLTGYKLNRLYACTLYIYNHTIPSAEQERTNQNTHLTINNTSLVSIAIIQITMYGKYRARSPPRNFKINFIGEAPLTPNERKFLTQSAEGTVRSYSTSAEDIQSILSKQLCRQFKKSVGVSVVVKSEDYDPSKEAAHMKSPSFRFTINEFLFRVWIHQPHLEFQDSIRADSL